MKELFPSLDPITSSGKHTGQLLREEVKEFLPLVRFLALTTDEFTKHVLPTGIFTDSEAVAILKTIKHVPGACLPEVAPLAFRLPRNAKSKSVVEGEASSRAQEATTTTTTTTTHSQGQAGGRHTLTSRNYPHQQNRVRGSTTNARNNTRPFANCMKWHY